MSANVGNFNSGIGNSGNFNSGDFNSGNRNSGNDNSGDCNSGRFNSGRFNAGLCNRGDFNSGDFNLCNHSSGCFNTVESTIMLFNKPSSWTWRDWRKSEARDLLLSGLYEWSRWVHLSEMTDEEKKEHPEAEAPLGYLKGFDAQSAVAWWKSLNKADREVIMAIPNFDKTIFKEITGIDVDIDSSPAAEELFPKSNFLD